MEELSLDLIFHNAFGKISKVLVTKLQVKNSLQTGQKSIKTFSVQCIGVMGEGDVKNPEKNADVFY